jgi:hypothetical protein
MIEAQANGRIRDVVGGGQLLQRPRREDELLDEVKVLVFEMGRLSRPTDQFADVLDQRHRGDALDA